MQLVLGNGAARQRPARTPLDSPEFRITLTIVLRIAESALKHGCTREEISHAFDLYVSEWLIDENTDPPKVLTVGPDSAGNFLELVGAPQKNGDHLIWHAMRCRPQYLALLPGEGVFQ